MADRDKPPPFPTDLSQLAQWQRDNEAWMRRFAAEHGTDPLTRDAWRKHDEQNQQRERDRDRRAKRQRTQQQQEVRRRRQDYIQEQLRAIASMYDKRDGHLIFNNGKYGKRLDLLSPQEVEILKVAHQLRFLGDLCEQDFQLICSAVGFSDSGLNPADAAKTYFEHVLNKGSRQGQRIIRKVIMGGAAWLTRDDIRGSVFGEHTDSTLILGPLADDPETVLQYSGNASLCTIAPPGAGKTQCHVLNNLVNFKGPAFVLDVKGEAWRETSKWRAKNVGPVWKFDPLDPGHSAHYNPFALIGKDRTWMESQQLAQALAVPGTVFRSDPYWENRGNELLATLIYCVAAKGTAANRNMLQVSRLASGDDADWRVLLKSMRKLDSEEARQNGTIFSSLMEKGDRQWIGVLDHTLQNLGIWRSDEVRKITSDTSPAWHPLRLRQKPYPTIYLCVSAREIETYASVLRVIISQHINALTVDLPDRDAMSILFCLDELPRLGKNMQAISNGIDLGRQYAVRLWMFAQHIGQLREAYENADGMIGACAVRIFMNPRMEDGTAQKVSDMLGYREGVLDGRRYRVAEPTDLTGPDYRDSQIVFGDGARAARLRKNFAYADPRFANRFGTYSPA